MTRVVSVIIPAFQAERWIEQAVMSCLAQTWREVDVIVLDDGSTDRTPVIVDAIRDSRVRLVRADVNEGLGVVLNRGLALAHGELVARLDADDTMLPWRLEAQVAHLDAHPEVGLLGTNAQVLELDRGAGRGPRRPTHLHYVYTSRALHWAHYLGCPLLHPTIMARRAALPPEGYPRGTRYSHDWALFLRMGRTTRLDMLARPCILYRRHADAIGIAHTGGQEASARAVFGRHLQEALGLVVSDRSLASWIHPWTAAATEDAPELAMLARSLAPDALDLGPTAPPWDGPGLVRCRRLWLYRLARILKNAPRHRALWRALAPLVAGGLARMALLR